MLPDLIGTALNPYMAWIKLAGYALAVLAVVGMCWYIKHVFDERADLLGEKAKLTLQLQVEQQKTTVAMEQLKQWQATAEQMNRALKNIRVEATTYIQGVENEKPPTVADGTVIDVVLPGSTANATLPRFENITAGGTGAVTAQGGGDKTR